MLTDGVPRDARLIYAAGFIRSATVSLVGVTIAIYLAETGFSTTAIGALIGCGLVGSSLATVAVSLRGDVWGRQRVLIALTVLTAIGYLALALVTDAITLAAFALGGMLNGMGRDRGAASALDQAILPEAVPPDRRTWALAWYNLVLDGGHAIGALAAAIPTLVMSGAAVSSATAHRATFLMCAGRP